MLPKGIYELTTPTSESLEGESMKRTLLFPLGLLVVGLIAGCPKEEAPKTEEPTPTEPTPTPTTAAQEEPKPVEEPPAAEVDKEVFIKAAYEVTCVRAKIEDTEAQKAILAEVFPRYGFDEASFAAAEKTLAGETTVQEAIKSKMEACTPELAAKLKEAGADAAAAAPTEEVKEDGKPEAKKVAAKPAVEAGRYSGAVTGGGLEDATLDITVRNDQGISANFVGKREGKRFALGLKGDLAKDGKFTLSGEKGPLNASVTGAFKSGTAVGQITGKINEKGLSAAFNAAKK